MTVSAFKIRYDADDEFKEAHLEYMKEKIKCTIVVDQLLDVI